MIRRTAGRGIRKPGCAALLAVAAVAAVGLASTPVAAQSRPGFMFRPPTLSLAVHAGYARPFARSDLFDQTLDELFIQRSDFQSPYLGAELAVRAADRVDVAIEVGHAWSRTQAEWQDFVEDDGTPDGRPIWQTVGFSRTPVTVGAKIYLADRGRSIGRFVWIPNRVTPYLGVGAGVARFAFSREGDHVDPETFAIYTEPLEHVGSAFTAHASFGLDVRLTDKMYLTPQARYTWARGGLDRSVYEGFEPLDLSGFQLSLGVGARF